MADKYLGNKHHFNKSPTCYQGLEVYPGNGATANFYGHINVIKNPREVTVPDVTIGDDTAGGHLTVTKGNLTLTNGNLTVTEGNGFFEGTLDGTPTGKLLDRIEVADSLPKPFDMQHPSKGGGHRLRYACIEGPEVGVYLRGRITNKTEIELPLYFKDLVHINSISVQLQPIGTYQNIIVKEVDDEKIHLQEKDGIQIDCYYHIYAERKDVNALVVEYEGESHKNYPDKNYNDPQYANRINTPTA